MWGLCECVCVFLCVATASPSVLWLKDPVKFFAGVLLCFLLYCMAFEHMKHTEILDLHWAEVNIQHADAAVVIPNAAGGRGEGSGYRNIHR